MKRVFNKLNGMLFAGLLVGVLLMGLGGGIAFAEYMGFDYEDLSEGEHARVTDESSFTMEADECLLAYVDNLTFDESVPVGTVLIKTEYNPATVSVGLDVDTGSTCGNGRGAGYGNGRECAFAYPSVTVINAYPCYTTDGFELFMQHKDQILQGLKEGRVISYETDYYYRTSAVANPADEGRVFIDYDDLVDAYESQTGQDWPLE